MKPNTYIAPMALALALALTAGEPALAQLPAGSTTLTPTQSPAATAIAAATETRAATVREVYGVDNSSGCDLLLPPGDANPVLYRKSSAGSRDRMEIFAGDTGLVLVGRDLALLQSASLRINGGATIQGTIVRRRLAGSQCGETPGNGAGVAVVRFAIPAQSALTSATLVMRTQRQYPPFVFKTLPCPANTGSLLEGDAAKYIHCFPQAEFDVDPIPVTLVPRPRITSLNAGSAIGGTGSFSITNSRIAMLATVVGTGLARMNALKREDTPGSAAGMWQSDFSLGIVRPTFMLTWFNPVAGQTATGRVTGTVPMLRFPRSSGGGINAARSIVDTAWAGGAQDGLRSLGEGRYAITALAGASSTGGSAGGGATPPPPAAAIKAFDPGNVLFNAGGGTTTVENTGVSATMTGLASESWCGTVPQPAFGEGGTRVVATGAITLPAIRWGVRNEGSAAFNGAITAELRLRGRVVDTLTFSGNLPAGGTQVKSFTRPIQQVTVGRESLGPKCFYVGNPGDPVLENSAYDVKVIAPAADTKTLASLP